MAVCGLVYISPIYLPKRPFNDADREWFKFSRLEKYIYTDGERYDTIRIDAVMHSGATNSNPFDHESHSWNASPVDEAWAGVDWMWKRFDGSRYPSYFSFKKKEKGRAPVMSGYIGDISLYCDSLDYLPIESFAGIKTAVYTFRGSGSRAKDDGQSSPIVTEFKYQKSIGLISYTIKNEGTFHLIKRIDQDGKETEYKD